MITEHRESLGTRALCETLGEPGSSCYRAARAPRIETETRLRAPSHRKLRHCEERHIHALLNSDRFVDLAPAEVFVMLPDAAQYYYPMHAMYRILDRYGETTERRQRPPRTSARPELLASGPKHVWPWDITKLRSSWKWK
jgi:putative transposase